MDNHKIGHNIRDARNALGLTQTELANRVGVSQQQIARWENDANMPNMLNIMNLAEALEIESSELMLSEYEKIAHHIGVFVSRTTGKVVVMHKDAVIGGGEFALYEDEEGNMVMDEPYYLKRLEIEEEYRNKGIGSLVLEILAYDIGEYYLTPDSEESQRLYSRLGWKIDEADLFSDLLSNDVGYGVYCIS